jgi:sugar lactone lactonase YvrE
VRFSTDESLLLVADTATKWVWSFQVQGDGGLASGEPFYRLETPDESSISGADGMTVDREGHLYVASRAGIQVCDQAGRVVAILAPPVGAPSSVVFGGPDLDWLYVTAQERVYRRHLRRHGVFPWKPVTPPQPRL